MDMNNNSTNQDSSQTKKSKILIIEDEVSLIDLLAAKLIKEGYVVQKALDGEEGLEKVHEWKPDLILLDIVMPKIDGYEVLEQLNKERNKIPAEADCALEACRNSLIQTAKPISTAS